MIKVTLLGDSIRLIGYGEETVKLLGKNFEVFQPEDNCRFCNYLLRGLFDWQKDMQGSKIVHFNSGLWDICHLFGDGTFTRETEYVETMLRIADILQGRYEKVIFATTTPVRVENPYNRNEDIRRFNELIVPKFQDRGIVINDLYALLEGDINRYIKDDLLHLSADGIQVCAEQVAKIIKQNT